MKRFVIASAILLSVVSIANAHTRHHWHYHHYRHHHYQHVVHARNFVEGLGVGLAHMLRSIGPRPKAWCGWQMRLELGEDDPKYNLARNWAQWGHAAMGPAIGVVVVWPHHVGRIVGMEQGRWLVHSGNDGHRVRTRPRSRAGVIAFREP